MRLTKKMLKQIAYGINQRASDLSELIDNEFAPETDKETIDAYKQCNKVSEWINYIESKRGYHAKV